MEILPIVLAGVVIGPLVVLWIAVYVAHREQGGRDDFMSRPVTTIEAKRRLLEKAQKEYRLRAQWGRER